MKEADWILEYTSSGGNLRRHMFRLCGFDHIRRENRSTCSIEGRATVYKMWSDIVSAEEKLWIDQKGCLRLKTTLQFPVASLGTWVYISEVSIARRI